MRGVWRLAVPLTFALAGILFATSLGASRGTDLRGGRGDLPDLIRTQEHQVTESTRAVERLRADLQQATTELAQVDRRIAAAQQRAAELSFAAGMGPVQGPGLEITLDDAPRAADRLLPEGASPDDLIVHQQDLQAVVNAMWAGGAEAMQIMDQRVISTSAVRCVGNTLILQGRVYSPPYVVTAIGDPERMQFALDSAQNVQLYHYYVDRFSLVYQTEHRRQVRLPGYAGSLGLFYAQTP